MKKQLMFLCGILLLAFSTSSRAIPIPVSLTVDPDPLGYGWGIECAQEIFGVCLVWGVEPTQDHTVSVGLSDGSVDVFNIKFHTDYADPTGLVQGYLFIEPVIGALGTLEFLSSVYSDFLVDGYLYDFIFNEINPDRFRYTLGDVAYILPDELQVPEPIPLVLIGIGLAVIGFVGWKAQH